MEARKITKNEETAYRLCFHKFEGLSRREAAKCMKISYQRVGQLLNKLKDKAPQLFPILTKQQYFIQRCIIEAGLSYEAIAELLKIEIKTVHNVVARLKEKGVYLERAKKTVRYEEWMKVQEKF